MTENTGARTTSLITGGVLAIALAGVFAAGLVVNHDDDSDATPAASTTSTTETFGVVTSGVGKVNAKPDQLTFAATVTNRRPTTAAALKATNHDVRAIIITAKNNGVDPADIETASVSIRPTYEYTRYGRRSTGFASVQKVQFLVKNLAKAGAVIGGVTIAGGNAVSVGTVQLGISNEDELKAEARTKAVTSSKDAAAAFAQAAGEDIGSLEYVEEVVPQTSYYGDRDELRLPSFSAKFLRAGDVAKSVAVSAGKQDISVTVQVRWSLAGQ